MYFLLYSCLNDSNIIFYLTLCICTVINVFYYSKYYIEYIPRYICTNWFSYFLNIALYFSFNLSHELHHIKWNNLSCVLSRYRKYHLKDWLMISSSRSVPWSSNYWLSFTVLDELFRFILVWTFNKKFLNSKMLLLRNLHFRKFNLRISQKDIFFKSVFKNKGNFIFIKHNYKYSSNIKKIILMKRRLLLCNKQMKFIHIFVWRIILLDVAVGKENKY